MALTCLSSQVICGRAKSIIRPLSIGTSDVFVLTNFRIVRAEDLRNGLSVAQRTELRVDSLNKMPFQNGVVDYTEYTTGNGDIVGIFVVSNTGFFNIYKLSLPVKPTLGVKGTLEIVDITNQMVVNADYGYASFVKGGDNPTCAFIQIPTSYAVDFLGDGVLPTAVGGYYQGTANSKSSIVVPPTLSNLRNTGNATTNKKCIAWCLNPTSPTSPTTPSGGAFTNGNLTTAPLGTTAGQVWTLTDSLSTTQTANDGTRRWISFGMLQADGVTIKWTIPINDFIFTSIPPLPITFSNDNTTWYALAQGTTIGTSSVPTGWSVVKLSNTIPYAYRVINHGGFLVFVDSIDNQVYFSSSNGSITFDGKSPSTSLILYPISSFITRGGNIVDIASSTISGRHLSSGFCFCL